MQLRYPGFLDKAVTLSYDDGVIFDGKLIGIMTKYGLKGTFNLNSGHMGNAAWRRLSKEDALKLYPGTGNEIAVHGVQHLSLCDYSDDLVIREVMRDRENLEELFGTVVRGMAYANGSCDDRVAKLAGSCGIVYSRTVVSTEKFELPENWLLMPATCHHNNPRLTELCEEFLAIDASGGYLPTRKPKLFYLWGHSYEFNDNDNWYVIEDFAKRMGGKKNIWYATNMEIWEYVNAYNSLIRSADGSIVSNPTAFEIFFIDGEENTQYRLAPGETVKL